MHAGSRSTGDLSLPGRGDPGHDPRSVSPSLSDQGARGVSSPLRSSTDPRGEEDGLRMAFRALLLAGGRGSRLESALPGLPKALVPIGGVPLLTLQLSRLRLEGCLQAVVVGGHGIRLVRNALATLSSSLQVVLV